jgi:hypothetical protein
VTLPGSKGLYESFKSGWEEKENIACGNQTDKKCFTCCIEVHHGALGVVQLEVGQYDRWC